MRFDADTIVRRYKRMAQNFLRHILSTSTEFRDGVDVLISTCNSARVASDQAIYSKLGSKPFSTIEDGASVGYFKRRYANTLHFGGVKGEHEEDEQHNLCLCVTVDNETPGHINFSNSTDLWDCYTPKWATTPHTLTDLNSYFHLVFPSEFSQAYDQQGLSFQRALIDLRGFLRAADNKDLTAEHILFVLPNLRMLLHEDHRRKNPTDSFKRRPRKIAGVPLPSITLKQALAVLASAQDILE